MSLLRRTPGVRIAQSQGLKAQDSKAAPVEGGVMGKYLGSFLPAWFSVVLPGEVDHRRLSRPGRGVG